MWVKYDIYVKKKGIYGNIVKTTTTCNASKSINYSQAQSFDMG